ncbi:maltase A3-like [Helicoverpa zea]|uniref:maltase A3-like n=1 Tax=Helicoverpa zea TaxID=7113 RepID=UPI001F55F2E7|nr:maltase A3-like [Helicoverpa zea]
MREFSLLVMVALAASVSCVDNWWKSAVVYQIYPRSFMDSNGDGKGDLTGIKNKLPYLQDLGVDAIWLSPIYKSPMYDFGYDIADYKSIDPDYGTMDDFDALMAEAKKLGVRVVLDYVPNHTSNESEWFVNSAKRNGTYADYYVWANGKTDESGSYPPSNWISIFHKSAWEYNKDRGQYYLHQFVIGQPDLNYRSQALQEEMKEVLRFWLRKGVSGFRVDAVNMLYEVDPADHGGIFPDEPPSNNTSATPDDYEYLLHPFTKDLNETYEVVYDWREVLDSFAQNETKIMMTEAYTDIDLMMRYYGDGKRDGSMPFNFVFLGNITGSSNANDMKRVIDSWLSKMPSGKVANWVNGNHDQSRMATRHGVNRVDAMNLLALILPGVTITYQGEELGMTDGYISWVDTKDPQACNTEDPINYWKSSRDVARTPFHWDSSTNAGFSSAAKTWLPVASNYQTVNVEVQKVTNKSHYHFYKDVVALKHTAAVADGTLGTHAVTSNVLVVTRIPPSSKDHTIVAIINLASTSTTIDLSKIAGVPENMKVIASGVDCALNKDATVKRDSVSLSGNCALAFENGAVRFVAPFLLYCITLILIWLQ